MSTIRLVPSTYYLSNSSYLSISNPTNAYTDTDSDTYATVTNSRSSTTSYYVYLRGFNFDDIPEEAIINSFAVKFKARESGVSTSSSYRPYMCNNTTTLTGTCSAVSTTATVQTFSGVTADWETIKEYGSNFGIRFNCRRASSGTTSYMYLYGAEIEVDYTIPVSATVTSSLNGSGAIVPSGAYQTYEGKEYELTITPANLSETVTVTKNGTDVTSELVAHGQETSTSRVLGAFTLVSGGFNSGESYFEGLEGNGVDASQTTSNYYSSSSSTRAVFTYEMGVTLPSNANISRVYCEVNGHAESTSNSNEYMCVQLISGSTELSEEINFKNVGTSNTTVTLECETLPTVSQLANMKLQCTLGYYGGAINGATLYVEYDTGGTVTHYTYTYTVDGDATIIVSIGGGSTTVLKVKQNGSWVNVTKAYKKVSGAWVEADISTLFNSTDNFKKG